MPIIMMLHFIAQNQSLHIVWEIESSSMLENNSYQLMFLALKCGNVFNLDFKETGHKEY